MSLLWEERLQHDPPRYDVPFGLGSIVAVPGPMVFDMEVDRSGPPLSPASRGTVGLRQHLRKVFPAMDGGAYGLECRPEANGVRHRHGRYAI